MRDVVLAAFLAALLVPAPAPAQEVRLEGYFIAREECPALQSIRRQTNPGAVRTATGVAYPILSKNRPAASHYRIVVEGAAPRERWVETRCGEHVIAADSDGVVPQDTQGGSAAPAAGNADYVLAFSWQPAFCETGAGQGKPECESQTDERFDATNFALHGLWPQPRTNVYCNIPAEQVKLDKDRKWSQLDDVALEADTAAELDKVMPGRQSRLDLHEWVKHGSCYNGEPAEEYFADSLAVMRAINASPARELFAANIGREVATVDIQEAFEEAFGPDAGKRIRVACTRDGNRRIITEITLGLSGEIGEEPDMAALIAAAPVTDPGCPGGVVDPVGNQ